VHTQDCKRIDIYENHHILKFEVRVFLGVFLNGANDQLAML